MTMLNDDLKDRLSAWIDGELPAAEADEIEKLVATNPEVAAEVAALSRLDLALVKGFAAELDAPLPAALTVAPAAPRAANRTTAPRYGWSSLAAALALVVVGAGGGAYVARNMMEPVTVVATVGWLDQVAEYHAIYATQTKHLVEVPASDPTLAGWLAKATSVDVKIPDLSAEGLTFQGGRLLVAGGKPVAQLMYTDASGAVVALCYVAGGDPALKDGVSGFLNRSFDRFQMVAWKDDHAGYVLIAPEERVGLQALAEDLAVEL